MKSWQAGRRAGSPPAGDAAIRPPRSDIPRWFLPVLLLAVLLSRLALAARMPHPGTSDPAFYYQVALNLASGRGFVLDYIWHYLSQPPALTHWANDYWMPLASVLMAAPMLVLGKSLFAALAACVAASAGLVLLTWHAAGLYTSSPFVRAWAAGLAAALPIFMEFSLRSEAPIFYALLAGTTLYACCRGLDDPRWLAAAAAAGGLAALTRQDGLLLLPLVAGTALTSRGPLGRRALLAAGAAVLFLAVFSPMMAANWRAFGAPLSPASGKTAWLTDYEDLYSYTRPLTPAAYLAWGWGKILGSKARVLGHCLAVVHKYVGPVLLIAAGAAAWRLARAGGEPARRVWPPALFLGLLLLFYSAVATFPGRYGGFERSGMTVAPFLLVFAVLGLEQALVDRGRARLAAVLLGLHVGVFLFLSANQAAADRRGAARVAEHLADVRAALARHEQPGEETVLLTDDIWETHLTTGYRGAQIPNEDLDTVYAAARRYGANRLLLPSKNPALRRLYRGRLEDPRFELLEEVPGRKVRIYRIRKDGTHNQSSGEPADGQTDAGEDDEP